MLLRILSIAKSCQPCVRLKMLNDEEPTVTVVVFEDRNIRSDSLVLPVDQNPQTEVLLVDLVVLCDPLLEGNELLLLEHTESSKVGRGKVLVIERGQVESSVSAKAVIRNDLGSQVQMLFILLPATCFKLLPLFLKTGLCTMSARKHASKRL